MAGVKPSHPRLLILNDPLQRINGVLLFPDLLLQPVETFQDQPHVDTHLIDVLPVTVDSTSNMVYLPLVVLKSLLFLDDVSPEICFQAIALQQGQFVAQQHEKTVLTLVSNWRCFPNILI